MLNIISRILRKAASEKKKEYLKNKYKLSDEEINLLEEADPTPQGKYLEWIIKQYQSGLVGVPTDSEDLRSTLERFDKIKNKRLFNDPKDINQYKTLASLKRTLSKYEEWLEEETKEVLKRKEKAGEGYREILRGPGYVWYEVTTPEAACSLGSGTSWCTVHDVHSRKYLEDGPLYILYVNNKPYIQLHFHSGQITDTKDNSIGTIITRGQKPPVVLLNKEYEDEKAIIDFFKKKDPDIVVGDKEVEEDYIREIKNLINQVKEGELAGIRERLQDIQNYIDIRKPKGLKKYISELLEALVKADYPIDPIFLVRLIQYYSDINGKDNPDPSLEKAVLKYVKDNPALFIDYLKQTYSLKKKLPEEIERAILNAASIIVNNPTIKYLIKELLLLLRDYIETIKKGSWKDLEDILIKYPYTAIYYASLVKKGRWPEAEEIIKKSYLSTLEYAVNIIKKRWPEAEDIIFDLDRFRELDKPFKKTLATKLLSEYINLVAKELSPEELNKWSEEVKTKYGLNIKQFL